MCKIYINSQNVLMLLLLIYQQNNMPCKIHKIMDIYVFLYHILSLSFILLQIYNLDISLKEFFGQQFCHWKCRFSSFHTMTGGLQMVRYDWCPWVETNKQYVLNHSIMFNTCSTASYPLSPTSAYQVIKFHLRFVCKKQQNPTIICSSNWLKRPLCQGYVA